MEFAFGAEELIDGPFLPDPNDWLDPGAQLPINYVSDPNSLLTGRTLSSFLRREEMTEAVKKHEPMDISGNESLHPPWSTLPQVVLSEVFRLLRDKDRISAARVCKHWQGTLEDPSLWRMRIWRFRGFSRADTARVISYARKYGHHMHNLSIHWHCMIPTHNIAKKFQSSMTSVLNALNTKRTDLRNNRHCELREFTLNQLDVECFWQHKSISEELIFAFCRFLRKQHKLEFCDFSNDTLNALDGINILDALGEGAGHLLKILNVENLFGSRLEIFSMPCFVLVMSSFHNLQSLMTNYNYLSEELLNQLTMNCAHKLKCLSIKVYQLDPYHHSIPPTCWYMLRMACPALRVSFYFVELGAFSDITRIACPEVPLKMVQIWTGMNYHNEYWQLSDTIRYLGKTFANFLEEACFYLVNPQEEIDEALLNFLTKTVILKALDMRGVIKLPTVATICEWQDKYKTCLDKMHVSAYNLSGLQASQLHALLKQYQPIFDERNNDFQLQANPGPGF